MNETVKRILLFFFLNIGLSIVGFLFVISVIYGEFPPPLGRLRGQLRQIQDLAKRGSELRAVQQLVRVNDAALNASEADGLSSGSAPPPPPPADSPSASIGGRIRTFTNSDNNVASKRSVDQLEAEVRQLRFKIQTIEAEQQVIVRGVQGLQAELRRIQSQPTPSTYRR